MIFSLSAVVPLFIKYKYLIIFPIVVVEGPIITIICGFLISVGVLDPLTAFGVVIVGDLIGDSLYYSIGRFGGKPFVIKYGHFFGLTTGHLEKLENHFQRHAKKTFAIGKASHGVGGLLLVASGLAKVPFGLMIKYNILPTLVKSLVLLVIGFYFGKAYLTISQYLDYAALGFFVLFIGLCVVLIKTKIFTKLIDKL